MFPFIMKYFIIISKSILLLKQLKYFLKKAKAAKEQVAFMVKRIIGIKQEIKPLDITDTIAIALTHAQRVR